LIFSSDRIKQGGFYPFGNLQFMLEAAVLKSIHRKFAAREDEPDFDMEFRAFFRSNMRHARIFIVTGSDSNRECSGNRGRRICGKCIRLRKPGKWPGRDLARERE
jgi:hypothetical protein